MVEMNYDELEAGPEMDIEVAVRVLGHRRLTQEEMREEAIRVWEKQPECQTFHLGFRARHNGIPNENGEIVARQESRSYSTDPTACMAALEKMREDGWKVRWCWDGVFNDDNNENDLHEINLRAPGQSWVQMYAPTFTLAACRAMLKAKGQQE